MNRRALLWMLLAVVAVMVGLWTLLGPGLRQAAYDQLAAEAPVVSVSWHIAGDGTVSGPRELNLLQGQRLQMTLVSDTEDAVHVHGYELHRALAPSVSTVVDVFLVHSGRYEVELHGRELLLTVLNVMPR